MPKSKSKTQPGNRSHPFKGNLTKVNEAHRRLDDTCNHAGALDRKTGELVKLGIALGANSKIATQTQIRRALRAGATPEEFWHVVVLATTTIGFANMLRGMTWLKESLVAHAASTPRGAEDAFSKLKLAFYK